MKNSRDKYYRIRKTCKINPCYRLDSRYKVKQPWKSSDWVAVNERTHFIEKQNASLIWRFRCFPSVFFIDTAFFAVTWKLQPTSELRLWLGWTDRFPQSPHFEQGLRFNNNVGQTSYFFFFFQLWSLFTATPSLRVMPLTPIGLLSDQRTSRSASS